MKFSDQIRYGNKAIWSRKVRSFLTMLGVIIGITAIISISSLSYGFELQMEEQFETSLSTNVVSVLKTDRLKGGVSTTDPSEIDFYFSDVTELEELEYVDTAILTITQRVDVLYQGENLSLSIIGVDFYKYQEVFPSQFEAEIGDIPLDPLNDTFVIGHDVYEPDFDIFIGVGQALNITWLMKNGTTIEYLEFNNTVSAVLNAVGLTAIGGPSDATIYLPLEKAVELFDYSNLGIASALFLSLSDSSEESLDTVQTELREFYSSDTITLLSANSMIETMQASMDSIFSFLSAIAGISLLVAGIGIMNTMYVSVSERTREIGILKALGIKNSSVLKIFLSETLIIGFIGGLLGLLVGYLFASVFGSSLISSSSIRLGGGKASSSLTTAITAIMTPTLALQGIGFGILLSVIFGLYPAWKASKKTPVDALRNQ
jgi:putative ABC transport system permease protein